MTQNILGLDTGTNSIGWALIKHDFENKTGKIVGLGSRIIPMSQDILGKFDAGVSISQTAERTGYRAARRIRERSLLRRERLHRVLNVIGFLPEHYQNSIDFENRLGQFRPNTEVKLNYLRTGTGKYEFLFKESFQEMVNDFKANKQEGKVPYDLTLYYLRKKALYSKISKEELAWILLNFNQKRGYFQLRGEELDSSDSGKLKEFKELEVANLIDSGEKVEGKVLYNVIFKNGWIYDKQIVAAEEWRNKSKEFIVTTNINSEGQPVKDKEGNIKRSFKKVDSEEDWVAIKAKTEREIDTLSKTPGEYVYDSLLQNPYLKINGKLIRTIERKYYKEELKRILESQVAHHPELADIKLYSSCLEELYSRNEAHRNNIIDKDISYLLIEDIIFYQRPLKSKKSTISGCQYERRRFIKTTINPITKKEEKSTISEPVKAIPKSNPLFQEFRLLQFLLNLSIYQKEDEFGNLIDKNITSKVLKNEEDLLLLFDHLNTIKSISQKDLLKFLIKKSLLDSKDKDNFRWNYVEDKSYPCNETRHLFLTKLKNSGTNKDLVSFLTELTAVGKKSKSHFLSREIQLWHIVYSVKDKKEFEKALHKFAIRHGLNSNNFIESFKKTPPFPNDYGAYSEKALKKLLPLMRIGKYWKSEEITDDVRKRMQQIEERLLKINYNPEVFKSDKNSLLTTIADDEIPKQYLKSFISFKNKNHLKGLNTYQACYAVYERHSESENVKIWKSPEDIDQFLNDFKQHSLRNPIVEQVLTETLRTVRDIWKYYGKSSEGFFDEIHLELGREMKNSAKKRKTLTNRVTENENTNERIKALLTELMNDPEIRGDVRPYSPSHQEILKIYEEGVAQNPNVSHGQINEKDIINIRRSASPSKSDIIKYKLWLDQGYVSPYTGKTIQLSRLFTSDYQIEHIIPQSRYFDNSISNKVICESDVNLEKGKQTAFEFITEKGKSIIAGHRILSLDEYILHCNSYFKRTRLKLQNLLSEDIPEGFINRQLNDSRYISKLVKGLLSNIVREENETDSTSKNLISAPGAITSKLRHDWGLNDKWNEMISSRFQKLNDISESNAYGEWDSKINAFRCSVPDEIAKGFSKKRIDHRHHALDALVMACANRRHVQYLNSLNNELVKVDLQPSLMMKNKQGDYTKTFLHPWANFTGEAKQFLEKTIISFKQNLRVINKSRNKTWQWTEKNGQFKKKLVLQTKGDNWAIRKSMHKETVSGKLNIATPKGKIASATRVPLSSIKTIKHIAKITDGSIQKILLNHLKNYIDNKGRHQFELAFNQDGVINLNENIVILNNGKKHQPIYKIRFLEVGNKFPVGQSGNKKDKYVESAAGTNLFFAIYWDNKKNKRAFNTIPLNEVIEHQKQDANLPRKKRTAIPIDSSKGSFLMSLSPNDLVYLPNKEEIEYPNLVNFKNIDANMVSRVYKMVSSTGSECHFVPAFVASLIKSYDPKSKVGEFGSLNKSELSMDNLRIKESCIKLNVDRLGNVSV